MDCCKWIRESGVFYMKIKGIIVIAFVLCLLLVLAGCGQSGGTQAQNMQNESVTDAESQTDSEENSTENKSSDTVTDANDNI